MTSIKLSESEPRVLSFDGNVLEDFYGDQSHRYHISWLKGFEFKKDNNGKHSISILANGGYYTPGYPVDENVVQKIVNLTDEIKRAKAAFQFD